MGAEEAFGVVERAIRTGPIPGAAMAVGSADSLEMACSGLLEPDGRAVTTATWYDLASLTKVLATTTLLLERVARGQIDPLAPVRDLLPEAAWLQTNPSLADVRLLELVTHTSGLAAWRPFYTLGLERATLLAHVLHEPIGSRRGEIVYSDVGFIVLGHLLERVACEPLEAQANRLFARLGLEHGLGFRPAADDCAPTERCPWRGRVLRGEVHDENAAALGGAAGHAGLFGSLEGVSGFAQGVLSGRVFAPPVLDYLAREHARGPEGERRGFGWALSHPGWSSGDLASTRTIGHTGFTGTGLWIDLERGRFSVLLTNRVHPSRHVESGIARLRRVFNQAAHAG